MSEQSNRAWKTAGQGAAAGASIGTMIYPGIGTAVGAVVGGAAGYIVGNQPVPRDHMEYSQYEIFNQLSSGAQYTERDEVTRSIKITNQEFIDADENAKTDDFMQIMGVGQSLASIYNANYDPIIQP